MQATIKLGLQAVIDNVRHCLGFSTLSNNPHSLWEAPQWACGVWKLLKRDQWLRGRWKPVCRIVGSTTSELSTTKADFQSSWHWLVTSTREVSLQSGLQDVKCGGWWRTSLANLAPLPCLVAWLQWQCEASGPIDELKLQLLMSMHDRALVAISLVILPGLTALGH